MDNVDLKLLHLLDRNSRVSTTDLAKAVGMSSQAAGQRVAKLLSSGVIKGCIAALDIHRLGLLSYRFYARIKNSSRDKEAEIIYSLVQHSNTLWVVSASGAWDLEAVFVARNFVHFSAMFKEWRQKWGYAVSHIDISMSPVTYRFTRDYLIDRARSSTRPTYFGFEPRPADIDDLDARLLAEVARNCRRSNEQIGQATNVSYHTAKDRLDILTQQGVIQTYSILLDLSKLGRRYIKILLSLEPFTKDAEARFLEFCARHNYVLYANEVLGHWQWEVEAEVPDYDTVYAFMREMRAAFPKHVSDFQLVEVTAEHKHNYLPHLQPKRASKVSKQRKSMR